MENLPLFQYNTQKPTLTGNARTTTVRFYPQGLSNLAQGVSPNNYVKFDFRTSGFWDPKSSYIHIDVMPELINSTNTHTIFQLDNSAQSIFSQVIIRHNGVELERNNEYDSLCAMLYDMNVGPAAREYMDLQGMGKNRNGYFQSYNTKGGVNVVNTVKDFVSAEISAIGGAGFTGNNDAYQISPTTGAWRPYLCSQVMQSNNELITNTATQTNSQLQSYHMLFCQEGVEGLQLGHTSPNSISNMYMWDGTKSGQINLWGYTQPYTEACVGTGEPWMTTGVLPRLTIAGGWGCYKKPQILTFVIPLMSPIWGPMATHGKLLPMALFNGLEFEFLINPYAFCAHNQVPSRLHCASNYSSANTLYSASENFTLSSANRTGWKITSFTIVTEIINLDQNEEDIIVQRAIDQGFNLPFDQWYLCQNTKFDASQQLNTTIQINHAFESLKMLTLRAMPADFETYSWSRKQQAISMNLTSLQLRVGTEYIPSTPIRGNCGNIRSDVESSSAQSNYVEFFIQTMKAWGKFFDMNDSTLLNPTNYTMNCTSLDPSTQSTSNTAIINGHLIEGHLGQTLFHNNRAVGRNMISIDLERFDIEKRLNSGLNTIYNRPFDILLENYTGPVTINTSIVAPDANNGAPQTTIMSASNFNRPFYLKVWALYAARLMYVPGEGWVVRGRA